MNLQKKSCFALKDPSLVLGDCQWAIRYLLIILMAVLMGFFYGRLRKARLTGDLIGRLTGKSHYYRVWDEFFESVKGKLILATLVDGKIYLGQVKFVSDNQRERELVLWNVHLQDSKSGEWKRQAAEQLLIPERSIATVHVVDMSLLKQLEGEENVRRDKNV